MEPRWPKMEPKMEPKMGLGLVLEEVCFGVVWGGFGEALGRQDGQRWSQVSQDKPRWSHPRIDTNGEFAHFGCRGRVLKRGLLWGSLGRLWRSFGEALGWTPVRFSGQNSHRRGGHFRIAGLQIIILLSPCCRLFVLSPGREHLLAGWLGG